MKNTAKNTIACYNANMTKAFKTIYTLLNRLEKGLDYEDFDAEKEISPKALKITENRWNAYIKMLNDAGYITGVRIDDYINGEVDIDISEVSLTLQGLQYLAENTMMVRMWNAFKTVKEVKDAIVP